MRRRLSLQSARQAVVARVAHVAFAVALVAVASGPAWARPPRAPRTLEGRPIQRETLKEDGAEGDVEGRFFVGAGLLSHKPGRISSAPSGAPSTLGLVFPALSAQVRFRRDWLFGPRSTELSVALHGTPIPRSSFDGTSSTLILAPLARLTRRWDSWDAGLGAGFLFYRVSGSGGLSTQRNGGSTQEFVLPGSSSLSIYGLLDLAAGVSFWKLRLDADLMLSGLLSSRRSADILLAVSYGFE